MPYMYSEMQNKLSKTRESPLESLGQIISSRCPIFKYSVHTCITAVTGCHSSNVFHFHFKLYKCKSLNYLPIFFSNSLVDCKVVSKPELISCILLSIFISDRFTKQVTIQGNGNICLDSIVKRL